MTTEALLKLPGGQSHRRIDFEEATVRPGFIPGTWFLIVKGKAPCLNMRVSLSPLMYVTCPEYWGIEVIGTTNGPFCLATVKPYVEAIPLNGIVGSKGIEVLGATRKKKIKVSGGCKSATSFVASAAPDDEG
jgi:hypothetical protein